MILANDIVRLVLIGVILALLITAGLIFRNNQTHPFYKKFGIAVHILASLNGAVLLAADFLILELGVNIFTYSLIFTLLIDAGLLFYGALKIINLNRK